MQGVHGGTAGNVDQAKRSVRITAQEREQGVGQELSCVLQAEANTERGQGRGDLVIDRFGVRAT